ncbi:MAG TPA: TIR domain-containing protein, partial [Ktedonobacteraceae bacterium]|nr:TIR domain-containing protein [Ktedonobacteraceae bacterium]
MKVDCAIITILPEEFQAVYDRFKPGPYKDSASLRTYGISRIQTREGNICTVAIARTNRQGNDASQQLANWMIQDLDPQVLLVVGIGGGVPDHDFTLGDVVISSHIHNFDLSAIKGNQTTYDVSGGVHPIISDITANLYLYQTLLADWNSATSIGMTRPSLLLSGRSFKNLLDEGIDEAWQKKVRDALLWHFDQTQRGRRPPKFLTAPIASSNTLIRSDAVLAQWLQNARGIRAVEMEAAGVYQAAQQMRKQYPVMAIRGISDIVGFKRNDDWKQYACHTAAAFAHAFISADIVVPRGDMSATSESTPSVNVVASQPAPSSPARVDAPVQVSQNLNAIKVFMIYDDADKQHKDRLATQLYPYIRSGMMELWDRDRFDAGVDHFQKISDQIASSRIILLLLSSHFSASEKCYTEMELAMRQRASDKATVIPIYIGHTDW